MRASKYLVELKHANIRPNRVAWDKSDPWGVAKDMFSLQNISWGIGKCEHWLLIGPNGSGKTTIGRSFCGLIRPLKGIVSLPIDKDRLCYVSFAEDQKLLSKFCKEAEFSSCSIPTVSSFLQNNETASRPQLLFPSLNTVRHKLLTDLSMSQLRLVSIERALSQTQPNLLVLDEPFDGLSQKECEQVSDSIRGIGTDLSLVLITHRWKQALDSITHVCLLGDQGIRFKGTKENFESSSFYAEFFDTSSSTNLITDLSSDSSYIEHKPLSNTVDTVINLKVFLEKNKPLSWKVPYLTHTSVYGPSALQDKLFRILTCQLPFSNPSWTVQLAGFSCGVGSGTSILQVRQKIAKVSAELQSRLDSSESVLGVVLSGINETMELMHEVNEEQEKHALTCLESVGMLRFSQRPFGNLSQGQQRLVMVARALVKRPAILVLKEAFQGLDPCNRKKLENILSDLETTTTIIDFTGEEHEQSDHTPNFANKLCL